MAAIIHESKIMHLPMAATVAELMNVDEPKARYMIRAVMQANLVHTKTRHRPAGAIVNRATTREYRVTMCQYCLIPWPCRSYLRQLRSLHGDAVIDSILSDHTAEEEDTDDTSK